MPARRCRLAACGVLLAAHSAGAVSLRWQGPLAALRTSPQEPEEPTDLRLYEPYYWWPSARGRAGNYSASAFEGPHDLVKSLIWEWHHPEGRFHTVALGVLIDDRRCLYLAADDGIRKLSPEGELLWTYRPHGGSVRTAPSLWHGALYGSTRQGFVFAVSMATGQELWSVQIAVREGPDSSFVQVSDGVVVVPSDGYGKQGADLLVHGLNASDGQELWRFRPDAPVRNFMAIFASGGTFVFQDREGRAYRNRLADGTLVWKAGGHPGTRTSGTAMLGTNGVVYTVATEGSPSNATEGSATEGSIQVEDTQKDPGGWLDAFRLEDGALLWNQTVPHPPGAFPALGRLTPEGNLTVVLPVGRQCRAGQSYIHTFDAETGQPQWVWAGPENPNPYCAGDWEAWPTRKLLGIRSACLPMSWSAPTIDAVGAIFVGNQDGQFYRIQDSNGDGFIEELEVSSYDAAAAFSPAGSAHAPGMVAVASCDGLYVFKN